MVQFVTPFDRSSSSLESLDCNMEYELDPYYMSSKALDHEADEQYGSSYEQTSTTSDPFFSAADGRGAEDGYDAFRYYQQRSGSGAYFSSMLAGIRDMVRLGVLPDDLNEGYITISGVTTRNPSGGRMLDYISHLLGIMDMTGTAERVGDGFYLE